MEVVATAKWVRITARKARLVTATIEGLPVAEALVILHFTPRAAARDVANVIKSAAANAEHNYNLDASTLRVARIEVEAAAIIKRFRPKPRGMSGSIFKRTAHLRAFVTDDIAVEGKRRRSVIRMPRTVVTAPAAGPSSETPAARRRRTAAAASGASADAGAKPARRRAAPKTAAVAAETTEPVADEATVNAGAVEESSADDAVTTTDETTTTEEPGHDAGEGDTK